MKRILIYIFITFTIIVAIYFAVTRNGLPIININNVKSVAINSGLVPIKQLNIENNKAEIENLISMYNKAKRSYFDGDTTPEISIVIQLKNGNDIAIQGNTQSYQYIYVNGKHYKVAGKELTNYFRTFNEDFNKRK